MSHRNKEGATLALTVTAVFLIVILGVGFFFLVQLLGGGREAQHATDAGNLNVAKQALISPFVPANPQEIAEFQGLFPTTGNPPVPTNTIDLVDYNRFVGKAFLTAANASEEGTTASFNNASTVLNYVEGPGMIGDQLTQLLANSGQTQNFFGALASSNSLRMLNWNNQNQISNDAAAYQVAYMRQNANAPTNLLMYPNELPTTAQITIANPPANAPAVPYQVPGTDTVASNNYLVGYEPVTVCAGGNLTIYGVPTRPGQQPHLVSQEDFANAVTSIDVQGGNSMIPPNAFQSQAISQEMHGANMLARSSAIIGSLGTQYDLAIPNGYIVVDNSNPPNQTLSDSYSTAPDIFGGEMMGNVYLAPMGIGTANPQVFADIQALQPDAGGNVYPSAADLAALQPSNPTQTQVNQLYQQLTNGGYSTCNNTNSFPGHPMAGVANDGTTNPSCVTALQNYQALVNSLQTGGTPTAGGGSNLMALEYMKAEIITIRGQFDANGCGSIEPPSNNVVTGLKAYSHSGVGNAVPFGNIPTVGTLWQFMQQTNSASNSAVVDQILQRMQEMNPESTQASIDPRLNPNQAPWNQSVPFGSVMYIYFDNTTTHAFALSASPPFGQSFNNPDGTPVNVQNVVFNSGTGVGNPQAFIDEDGDGGFPHPFDCPPDFQGSDVDNMQWTPSTGFQNQLGTIKFTNQAAVGVTWCCPC